MRKTQGLWLAGLAALAAFSGPARADGPPVRTVSVTGAGEVSAAPDLARISLGVESRKPTIAEARTEVAATVERVLALTRSLKIDPKLVNSTRLQVSPLYVWDEKARRQQLEGYVVSRQVEVELRDLDQLGTLLEKAVDVGVNQVGDPQLDSSRRKSLEREAMGKAVQDAKLNAEALVAAAGARLGAIRNLNGQSNAAPVPMYRRAPQMAMAADAGGAPETYQAGDMKFNASVSAEYDLVPGP
ncbi:MAG TPA: SIMPL domain-containing protein [Steroidobacteraceae bacterium]